MQLFDITRNPVSAEVKRARLNAGHTQEQAAATIGRKGRKRWSEFETGVRPMQRETLELYLLLTDQHPMLRTLPRAA